MKTCARCKQEKSLDEFGKDKTRPDGHFSYCKVCAREKQAETRQTDNRKQYMQEFRESGKAKEALKKYRQSDKGKRCRELYATTEAYRNNVQRQNISTQAKLRKRAYDLSDKGKQNARHYSVQNRDAISHQNQRRYQQDSQRVKARTKQWRKDNPHKYRAMQHKRRARKKEVGGAFTAEQWTSLCERFDNRCVRCGELKSLTVDHVIPVSCGGSNDISNIQPLCGSCNSSKAAKTIDYRFAL